MFVEMFKLEDEHLNVRGWFTTQAAALMHGNEGNSVSKYTFVFDTVVDTDASQVASILAHVLNVYVPDGKIVRGIVPDWTADVVVSKHLQY